MKFKPQYIKLLIVFFLFISTTACSLKKAATTTIGKVAYDGTIVVESEEDVELARNSIPSLILTLEVFAQGNPDDKTILTLLARSYGQYAFGFIEEDLIRYKGVDPVLYDKSRTRAKLFYKKGMDYGLRSLWKGNKLKDILSSPQEKFEKELKRYSKKQVPSLFWAAFCWGCWINLNRDDPEVFIDVSKVEAMVKRVIELDSTYYFGSAHSFLGAMASTRPVILGGNPSLAKESFNKAISISPEYLMNKVLFAQYYGVQFQDKKMFEEQLDSVEKSINKGQPNMRLANELAMIRAKLLLQREKDFF